MEFDNSKLQATAKCSTMAAIEYVLHLRPIKESAPLKAGSDIHTGLEAFFRTGEQPAIKAFENAYKVWSEEQEDLEERFQFGNVRLCFGSWLEKWHGCQFPWVSDELEIGFKINLKDGDFFTGLMDILGHDQQTNMIVVVDHKTTGRLDANWINKWKSSSQITGYLWAAEILTQKPVYGCYINGIDLKRVPASSRKCKDHGVTYYQCGVEHLSHGISFVQRTREQVNDWWTSMQALKEKLKWIHSIVKSAEDLIKLPQEGTFNEACRFCGFKDFCHLYGRRAETLGPMTRHDEWDPLKGTKIMEGSI